MPLHQPHIPGTLRANEPFPRDTRRGRPPRDTQIPDGDALRGMYTPKQKRYPQNTRFQLGDVPRGTLKYRKGTLCEGHASIQQIIYVKIEACPRAERPRICLCYLFPPKIKKTRAHFCTRGSRTAVSAIAYGFAFVSLSASAAII